MAFVCTVEFGEEIPLEYFVRDREAVVKCTVGYDDRADTTFSVMAALSPLPGGDLELVFAVLEGALDGEINTYRNGLDSRTRIQDPGDRRRVLAAVCTAIDQLVRNYGSDRIVRCVPANLPERAMVKHVMIHQIFKEAGYLIQDCGVVAGTQGWRMERPV